MKKLFFLTVFLMATLTCFGEEAKGIFYKATKGNKTIYLFGDCYSSKEEVMPVPNSVQSKYNNCKTVIMGTNYNKNFSSNNEYKRSMFRKMFYLSGSIEDDFSPDTIELLKTRLKEVGLEYFPVYRLAMQVAHLSVGQSKILFQGTPSSTPFNIENKNITYALKLEEMLNYIVGMSNEEFEAILKISFADIQKNAKIERAAWINGEEKVLADTLMSYYSEYDYNFIDYITNKYMETINKEVQNVDELFVIAQVEQIVLNNSLPNKLLKEGYKIERIN